MSLCVLYCGVFHVIVGLLMCVRFGMVIGLGIVIGWWFLYVCFGMDIVLNIIKDDLGGSCFRFQ